MSAVGPLSSLAITELQADYLTIGLAVIAVLFFIGVRVAGVQSEPVRRLVPLIPVMGIVIVLALKP